MGFEPCVFVMVKVKSRSTARRLIVGTGIVAFKIVGLFIRTGTILLLLLRLEIYTLLGDLAGRSGCHMPIRTDKHKPGQSWYLYLGQFHHGLLFRNLT